MNRLINKLILLSSLAIALPWVAVAADHIVIVKDSFFSPADLLIQPGDTVFWRSEAGGSCGPYGGECPEGIQHTVTADDFSFSSGEPSEDIFFVRDFNDAGVILYHCEVHSEPGKDIDVFMNGRITVQGEEPVFQINEGLNDAWFNPDTDRQGFFITVFPDLGVVVLAWFSYETEPVVDVQAMLGDAGHRWLIAVGPFIDNMAVMDIEIASGGVFDTATVIERRLDGSDRLTFAGCNSGTVDYDIPSINRSGIVEIQRVAKDNIGLCDSLNAD